MNFNEIIKNKLLENKSDLKSFYSSSGNIKYFYIDNLFPEDIAIKISLAFSPKEIDLFERKSLREYKRVGVKYDQYDPILSKVTEAIHSPEVISVISEITGLKKLEADEKMYAAGLSSMAKGNFLNPHLDNSHDFTRSKYRTLNLLYYTTENWKLEFGGNLELWPEGVKKNQITVHSKFNRLVVMKTDKNSWHSVSKVEVDSSRNCISNYYFSELSPDIEDYKHVTSFRGRSNQFFRDIL